jgi:hypothetical protein
MTTYTVRSDTSGHNLPIGAIVTPCPGPAWSDPDVDWYTQGGDGDDVAIDPADLEERSDAEIMGRVTGSVASTYIRERRDPLTGELVPDEIQVSVPGGLVTTEHEATQRERLREAIRLAVESHGDAIGVTDPTTLGHVSDYILDSGLILGNDSTLIQDLLRYEEAMRLRLS